MTFDPELMCMLTSIASQILRPGVYIVKVVKPFCAIKCMVRWRGGGGIVVRHALVIVQRFQGNLQIFKTSGVAHAQLHMLCFIWNDVGCVCECNGV